MQFDFKGGVMLAVEIIKCGRTDVNCLYLSPLHSLIAAHAHKI